MRGHERNPPVKSIEIILNPAILGREWTVETLTARAEFHR
jgi:hypothetical protein